MLYKRLDGKVIIETSMHFEERRIRWVAKHLFKNGDIVKKSIVRQLSKCRIISPEINVLLQQVVDEYHGRSL
ncbi:hypothetical protein MUG87_01255 [Ectobacillus sp. JY-23]|uniref:hypothetical protein n=1 Tax=Ectobacillus sp. JY-23 TaxID=2933872 RepID=UPI001FF5508E|nr:hypothetical protein [Ectobacillus sp. JY-23]UOY92802.1 hypothetical protein MUG87_01255 [Ectobacillus sp. JY-23]